MPANTLRLRALPNKTALRALCPMLPSQGRARQVESVRPLTTSTAERQQVKPDCHKGRARGDTTERHPNNQSRLSSNRPNRPLRLPMVLFSAPPLAGLCPFQVVSAL